jgi:enoyl-CoA hydratase/carnithine racemase
MSEYLQVERRGRVAIVRFTRPEKLNIFSRAAISALHQTVNELAQAHNLGAVIITGSGRAFVGGADVREMRELEPGSAREFITALHNSFEAIRSLPVPVIAAVNGYALGAGCELLTACDLRIAASNALIGMPEIKVGIPSVIEAALLVPLVGLGKATELVLTGENIDAREAERIGLVNKVVAPEALEEEALALAEKLAGYSPRAMRLQKQLIRRWLNLSGDDAIHAGVEAFSQAFMSNDPQEAMTAFLEKRPPRFSQWP